MTEPLQNHGDHGGAIAVYAVQAPQWHRASGVTGVLTTPRIGEVIQRTGCHIVYRAYTSQTTKTTLQKSNLNLIPNHVAAASASLRFSVMNINEKWESPA